MQNQRSLPRNSRLKRLISYMLTDHLGSTSITTNASGAMTSQMKYKAWGEVRFASGTNPTKHTYTGQYSNVSDFGLMFYNARWYDPVSGRFAQADTIIPNGIQGWDHYAYVSNSPMRYIDPSGHFGEEELEGWFGKNWRDRFSSTMIAFLREAQLGDVLHGEDLSFMFVLDQEGVLAAWDLQSSSLGEITQYNDVDPKTTALYRPRTAGSGPTDTDWNPWPSLELGEGIGNPAYSDPPYERIYDLGCKTCNESYQLPHGWYQGENNGIYVSVWSGPVGIDFDWIDWSETGGAVVTIGRTIIKGGSKGVLGGAAWLTINIVGGLQWDTFYIAQNGNVAPVPQTGIPVPPVSSP